MPLVLLVGLLAWSAWSDDPMPRADLTVVERAEVNTLDPARISWNHDIRVSRALYEGLLVPDVTSADLALVPGAASSMPEVSDGGRVYVFRVREDARWSDGSAVTAGDFVYAWRRAILPDSRADYAEMFMPIRGVSAFRAVREAQLAAYASGGDRGAAGWAAADGLYGEALRAFEGMVGIEALDDRAIRVELERPLPYFLEFVSFPAYFPLPKRVVSSYESIDGATGEVRWGVGWTKPPVFVGNGAFRLERWRFRRDMRLERNEYYHSPGRVGVGSLSVLNIADGNAMVTAFATGAVDWTTDVLVPYRAEMLAARRAFMEEHAGEVSRLRSLGLDEVEIVRRLPDDARAHIHEFPSFGTFFLNLNCSATTDGGRPNPLADARVRRALALSVDKAEVVRDIRRTSERVAGSLVPPGSITGYDPPGGLGFDPERSRAELVSAGYPGGVGLPELELLFRKDAGHDLVAQALKRNWERHLGVRVRLAQVDSRVFSDRVRGGRYMISTASWFGDYGDPTTFLDLSRSTSNNNDRNYTNPSYDAMMDAAGLLEGSDRMSALAGAERVIVERDLPLIPVFHYTQVYLFNAHRVRGLTTHPRQTQMLPALTVSERAGGGVRGGER